MPKEMEESAPETATRDKKWEKTVADRYLDLSRMKEQKAHLGQKEKRVENITAGQAMTFPQQELKSEAEVFFETGQEVEVDPIQSMFIDDTKVVFFRRIVIENRIYRQGLVILVDKFMEHLINSYFLNQPMSRFARLSLFASDQGIVKKAVETGAAVQKAEFTLNRRFPRPFSFLTATLSCEDIPRSPGRNTLNAMMALMVMVVFFGIVCHLQKCEDHCGNG